MKTSTQPFDLLAWRVRMQLTQARAAAVLGVSPSTYRESEYRSSDRPGHPVNKTLARLALMLERHGVPDEWRA